MKLTNLYHSSGIWRFCIKHFCLCYGLLLLKIILCIICWILRHLLVQRVAMQLHLNLKQHTKSSGITQFWWNLCSNSCHQYQQILRFPKIISFLTSFSLLKYTSWHQLIVIWCLVPSWATISKNPEIFGEHIYLYDYQHYVLFFKFADCIICI